MATVRFWGGVGVIGSSKILIEQDGWRVLLDFGLDYTPGVGLFQAGLRPRPGRELYDRLMTGVAPRISHVYAPQFVEGTGLPGGTDGRTALFITHAHLDHMGLTGFVDPALPMYASPDTVRLLQALADAGDRVEGGAPVLQSLQAGGPVQTGPFRVTRFDVEHDVAGASGYRVETEDGAVAFTGDIRLHGRHPETSLAFAEAVRGARALVIEGTTLSFGFGTQTRTEEEVDALFGRALRETPGLVMVSLYHRNVERAEAFLALAEREGRRFLWPKMQAEALSAWFGRGLEAWGSPELTAEVRRHPERFVVQLPGHDAPWMLDFGAGPGSVYLHANGDPLGPYDPLWHVVQDWLQHLHVPFWPIGTGGHA
ncbi:MAG: MBL fold metallo-hydrolase, partial [Clostridia bacterium]